MPTESPRKRAPAKKAAVHRLDDARKPAARRAASKRRGPVPGAGVQTSMPTAGLSIVDVALSAVVVDPDNVRTRITVDDEFVASIREQGVLEPLLVTTIGNDVRGPAAAKAKPRYMIVAGHRRHEGARQAGLQTVPVIVRTFTPLQRLEAQLVENLHRDDLNELEEAAAYQRMLDLGVSQRQLSDRVHRSQPHISKRIKLLTLPAKAQARLADGELNVGDALELARLAHDPKLVSLAFTRKNQNSFRSYKEIVDRIADDTRRARAHADAVAKLRAAGENVIAWPDNGWYATKAKPLRHGITATNRWWHVAVVAPITTVRKNGHLAVSVDPRDASTLWICTDPKAYTEPKKSAAGKTVDKQKAEQAAAQAAARDEAKQREAAADERMPYLRKVVAEGWGNEFVGALLADGHHPAPVERIACDILEIEPEAGSGMHSLRALAERALTQATRVGMAVALARVEWWIRDGDFDPESIVDQDDLGAMAARLFYAYLDRNGYMPSTPWEKKLVAAIPGRAKRAKAS